MSTDTKTRPNQKLATTATVATEINTDLLKKLSKNAGEEMRTFSLTIKASPKVREDLEKLTHEVEGSVFLLAKRANSEEALEHQIKENVTKAKHYITDVAEAEKKKEKEEAKKHDAKDHTIHGYHEEKPASAEKTIQEKAHDKLEAFRAELRGEEVVGVAALGASLPAFTENRDKQLQAEEQKYIKEAEKAKLAGMTTQEKTALKLEELHKEIQSKEGKGGSTLPHARAEQIRVETKALKEEAGLGKPKPRISHEGIARLERLKREAKMTGKVSPHARVAKIRAETEALKSKSGMHWDTDAANIRAAKQEEIKNRRLKAGKTGLKGRTITNPSSAIGGKIIKGSIAGRLAAGRDEPYDIEQDTTEYDTTETTYRGYAPTEEEIEIDEGSEGTYSEDDQGGGQSDAQGGGRQHASRQRSRGGGLPGMIPKPHILRGGLGGGLKGGGAGKLLGATPVGRAILLAPIAIKIVKYVAIGIGALLFFILFILGGEISTGTDPGAGEQANPLKITKTGPPSGAVGQELVYTITATYPGTAEDVIITDPIPQGTDYVSSTPAGAYDAATRKVTWSAKTLALPLTNPINMSVSLTLRSTQDNLKIVNQATVNLVGGVLAGGAAGWVAPSDDNCGGKYTANIAKTPLKKNFGDPQCNMTKDLLYQQLKQDDPANADFWFNKVVPCESGYNPNAYLGPQGGTPDANGAWGLYQMGSANPPGTDPSHPGKNGPNDRGDVPWNVQTTNATTYGKKISSLGAYWACAR